ncbi:DNA-processing protein DprA [Streptomyces sp. ISL-44]|uniref:DNA-processing protein DprA n=1 Tax=Streptomyces sp. ISL-44 TaxID=2819184 RepID=UPI0027E2FBCF|nr:DNA-processing protein DprA [Streptomyces sp. ISL-44]
MRSHQRRYRASDPAYDLVVSSALCCPNRDSRRYTSTAWTRSQRSSTTVQYWLPDGSRTGNARISFLTPRSECNDPTRSNTLREPLQGTQQPSELQQHTTDQRTEENAALTRGTVVVEAAHRSGSLVTARRAQELGRFTMGVPGPATSGLSAGVHELLRGEAVLVTDAAEVVELVGSIGELAPERRGPVLARDLLDPETGRVLEALPAGRPVQVEEVALASGNGTDEVIGRLYELHSLGFVERQGEGWQLTGQTPGGGTQTGATRRGGR